MRFLLSLLGMVLCLVVGVFVEHDFNVVNLTRNAIVQPVNCTCTCDGDPSKCTCNGTCCPCSKCGNCSACPKK